MSESIDKINTKSLKLEKNITTKPSNNYIYIYIIIYI